MFVGTGLVVIQLSVDWRVGQMHIYLISYGGMCPSNDGNTVLRTPSPATEVFRRLSYESQVVTRESELSKSDWNEQIRWTTCLKLRGDATWVWPREMDNTQNSTYHMETARSSLGHTSVASQQSSHRAKRWPFPPEQCHGEVARPLSSLQGRCA